MRPLQIRARLASCSGQLMATTARGPRMPPFGLPRTYSSGRVSCVVRNGQKFHSRGPNGAFLLNE